MKMYAKGDFTSQSNALMLLLYSCITVFMHHCIQHHDTLYTHSSELPAAVELLP